MTKMTETAIEPVVLTRDWIPMAEAMELLGKSQSTVERLARRGVIGSKEAKRIGRRPERLYYLGDVQKLKEARSYTPATTALALPLPESLAGALNALAAAFTAQATRSEVPSPQPEPAKVALTAKLWLRLPEARELSGLCVTHLKQLCRQGKLVWMYSGRSLVIQRKSLEEFEG